MDEMLTDQDIALKRENFDREEDYNQYKLFHSTAHIMAYAVQELYGKPKFAFGPPTKDGTGFYYDIDLDERISEEDFPKIEEKMAEIAKKGEPFKHEDWTLDKAKKWFEKKGQDYKIDQIENLKSQGHKKVSIYQVGKFTDLCAGPHIENSGKCGHFKLLAVSGAFFRGDPRNPQLQRLYGTVWPTREKLEEFLELREQAKKRDHRKLGVELDLLHFEPELAPGIPFWLPKGATLYHLLSNKMRHLLLNSGYVEVKTPQLFRKDLWETSGHWQHFKDNMFNFQREDGEHLSLKPMNCPSHMLIFRSKKRSYRDLPLRIHDQGVLFRNEPSGTLGGLTRVRQFCQDDAHIFIPEALISEEIFTLLDLVKRVYDAFDMKVSVELSTRPEKAMGAIELWKAAEEALESALQKAEMEYKISPGEGAFYGPKIDFMVEDSLKRTHQCATVQLDFQLPRNFQLFFTNAQNKPEVPVVIHRAIYGSFERFLGVLIEHYGGAFPVWMAPEQCRVIPVSKKFNGYAEKVLQILEQEGARVFADLGNDRCGAKIRLAELQKIPYMLVLGGREEEAGTVSLRSYEKGEEGTIPLEQLIERLRGEIHFSF